MRRSHCPNWSMTIAPRAFIVKGQNSPQISPTDRAGACGFFVSLFSPGGRSSPEAAPALTESPWKTTDAILLYSGRSARICCGTPYTRRILSPTTTFPQRQLPIPRNNYLTPASCRRGRTQGTHEVSRLVGVDANGPIATASGAMDECPLGKYLAGKLEAEMENGNWKLEIAGCEPVCSRLRFRILA